VPRRIYDCTWLRRRRMGEKGRKGGEMYVVV
jgi:hypothetical protein